MPISSQFEYAKDLFYIDWKLLAICSLFLRKYKPDCIQKKKKAARRRQVSVSANSCYIATNMHVGVVENHNQLSNYSIITNHANFLPFFSFGKVQWSFETVIRDPITSPIWSVYLSFISRILTKRKYIYIYLLASKVYGIFVFNLVLEKQKNMPKKKFNI